MAKKIIIIVCSILATILLFHKVDADSLKPESPKEFSFPTNYHDPFIPEKPIKWTVPDSCHVEIIFYNVMGDVVDTFVNEFQTAGFYEKDWNPKIKINGVYCYRMVICEDTIIKRYFYMGSNTQSDTAKAIDKSDSLQDQTPKNKHKGE